MRECDETMLNKNSMVPENANFVFYDEVVAYIQSWPEYKKYGKDYEYKLKSEGDNK